MPRSVLLAPLALALLAAGCFGADAMGPTMTAEASGGKVSPGWAYDGAALVDGGATLNATLDNVANTGVVHVEFSYGGDPYVVHFDRFAQAEGRDFQDGGIAFDLDEHGSSGNGDLLLPKFHARAAAWGTASVTRAGVAEERPWTAHLMLSDDTVRGRDGRIANAAGGPYDPAKPDDAQVVQGQPQAIFTLRHPDGDDATKAPVVGTAPLACAGPCDVSTAVPVEPGASAATIDVTLTPVQGPVGAGQGEVRLQDANGTDVVPAMAFQLTPANAPLVLPIALGADALTGPLTVRITGNGAFNAVVDHEVAYDLTPFLVVTWDEPTYG